MTLPPTGLVPERDTCDGLAWCTCQRLSASWGLRIDPGRGSGVAVHEVLAGSGRAGGILAEVVAEGDLAGVAFDDVAEAFGRGVAVTAGGVEGGVAEEGLAWIHRWGGG